MGFFLLFFNFYKMGFLKGVGGFEDKRSQRQHHHTTQKLSRLKTLNK